jgi:ABC-type antimicrobial peptide transport system permease subunit
MAVRMAVGAGRSSVLALVLSHGLRLAVAGLLAGSAGAILVGRGMRALLPDVQALDVATLSGVATILLLASVAASLLPALSSARTPPADALREEA